jgi:diguanylate cyclase (GGDEF)-like protein
VAIDNEGTKLKDQPTGNRLLGAFRAAKPSTKRHMCHFWGVQREQTGGGDPVDRCHVWYGRGAAQGFAGFGREEIVRKPERRTPDHERLEDESSRERSTLRLVGTVVSVIVCAYLVVDPLLRDLHVNDAVDLLIEAATLACSASIALWFVVLAPLRGDTVRERALTRHREGALRDEVERQEFDARVHRAMEMAGTEAVTYDAVARALERGTSRLSAELLLADSSEAHLKRSAHAAPDGGAAPGCQVASPRECPAIRRSQTLVFPSAEEIDACPHLAGRPEGDRSAVCVPVSVGGRSIGVLHATAAPTDGPTPLELSRLEALATQAGARIGMLRVMEATHLQAATDPLTGLLNRRSFENRVQDLLRRRTPFTLAMSDLDYFKALNDTHGHDAGDRALRLFARTLQAAVRSDDLVCRYGGEEFVIAFPNLSVDATARALARVQEQLVLALSAGSVPPFTASFGVADSADGGALEDLCRAADVALFRAKREGRNRVVVDDGAGQSRPLATGPGVTHTVSSLSAVPHSATGTQSQPMATTQYVQP